ncbi:acyltransferase [Candidatus Saccharibacteria bacterium]|nr:MAG: acyltransferase [Candidatus Saccharibacteria bacterium]
MESVSQLWFKRSATQSDEKTSTNTKKITALDSVRGIAAFSVILWHFASIFFPAAIGAGSAYAHSSYDFWFYHSPLASLFSGSLAVSLFFILSGFVLSLRFFENKQSSLFTASFKRYFRLMPVAFFSIIMSYAILSLGYYTNSTDSAILHSPWTGNTYFSFSPSFIGAIWQGLIGAFTLQAEASSTYNPVLWTIYYELLGSFIIFGLASMCRGMRRRWLLYSIAIAAFIHTYFVGFIAGMILADIFATFPAIFRKIAMLPWPYKICSLLLAFAIGSYPSIVGLEGSNLGKYWQMLTLSNGDLLLSRTILQLIAGVIIIILVLSWDRLRRLLENPVASWLGNISYTVYAVHLILLYSLTTTVFVYFRNHLEYMPSAFLSLLTTLPVILFVAHFMHIYIERPSIALANRIGEWAKK